jgi:hypothetical protein
LIDAAWEAVTPKSISRRNAATWLAVWRIAEAAQRPFPAATWLAVWRIAGAD